MRPNRSITRRSFLKRANRFNLIAALLVGLCLVTGTAERNSTSAEETFRAGAYAVDTSPRKLPAIVNGYTFERIVDKVHDPLFARCLVLDDGSTRVTIVVVDICVMPRDLIDRAKRLACERTSIPADRMLISATHTHSAPSVLSALGSNADPDYVEYLPGRIAEGIRVLLFSRSRPGRGRFRRSPGHRWYDGGRRSVGFLQWKRTR